MTAACEQTDEGRLDGSRAEVERRDMPLEVIDRHKRDIPRPGDRLGRRDADEEGTDETGATRHPNPCDVAESHPRLGQCLADDRTDQLEVTARRDLWHHAAVAGVELRL